MPWILDIAWRRLGQIGIKGDAADHDTRKLARQPYRLHLRAESSEFISQSVSDCYNLN